MISLTSLLTIEAAIEKSYEIYCYMYNKWYGIENKDIVDKEEKILERQEIILEELNSLKKQEN
tara:strand:+ start:312 stop:500 length:189 start_codon:yes stop_codon:yes gene_type:complete